MTTPVFIDFETCSGVSLREVGGRRYATHSSTMVLCAGFITETRRIIWIPDHVGGELPAILEDGTEVHRGDRAPKDMIREASIHGLAAHNASSFDRHVWNHHVGTSVSRWVDTIHLARSNGLPAGLDKLGQWYTGSGKDDGKLILHKLMKLEWDLYSQRWWNKWILPGAVTKVALYCMRDVDLLKRVYEEVSTTDANDIGGVEIDQTINDRGIGFDEELAAKIAAVSTGVVLTSGKEIERITTEMGKPLLATELRSIPKVKTWLKSVGVHLDNMRRKTVEAFIANPDAYLTGEAIESSDHNQHEECTDDTGDDRSLNVTPDIIKVLKLRNSCLRVTGAKLERASASAIRGRLYDLFVYHGAHTGRWSSRIVQVHNLPRGAEGLNLPLLCGDLSLDTVSGEAARLGILPDDVLSALIRPTLIPPEGYEFVISDFNAIENRVLHWCADDDTGLRVFRENLDPYKAMATMMYGVAYEDVTKEQRQVAKVPVLGCGYGLGHKKLGDFAAAMRIDLAKLGIDPQWVVEKYRTAFPKIAGEIDGEYEGRPIRRGGLWRDVEQAFRDVSDGTRAEAYAGKCRFTRESGNTIITLPSGRRLTYRKARLEPYIDDWGRERTVLSFTSGRGDVRTYGGKLVENIVQAIARDLLKYAMIEAEASGIPISLHVHDEIVGLARIGRGDATLIELNRIMSVAPSWATDLPLAADGHVSPRYTKTAWLAA